MASKSESDDEKKLVKVLENLRSEKPKKLTDCEMKMPSTPPAFILPNFVTERKSKVKAVKDSFVREEIDLKEKRGKKSKEKRGKKSSSSKSNRAHALPSPQTKGTEIHYELAKEIKSGTRESTAGKMLKSIEGKFKCKFLKAEVPISGYAVRKSKVDYYRGSMDAVAFRLRPKGVLEVFVVDWKTTSNTDVAYLDTWWDNATNFKDPLYQCLLYRELLQMKLKLNGIKAQVGIMLVPFLQSDPELLVPGLCMDVKTMDKKGLLQGLKEYRWFAKETSCVHTIKMPCNLFEKGFAHYVDESTEIFKEESCLKDIFSDDANIGMLCRELGLLKFKVEDEGKSEDESKSEENKEEETNDEDKEQQQQQQQGEEEEEGEVHATKEVKGSVSSIDEPTKHKGDEIGAEGDVTKNVRGKVAEKKIIKPINKGAKGKKIKYKQKKAQ